MMKDTYLMGFQRDTAALVQYFPRSRAIELVAQGEISTYLDWHLNEAWQAAYGRPCQFAQDRAYRLAQAHEPLPLDRALAHERMALAGIPYAERGRALAKVYSQVEHFMESPLEIAIRQCSPATFSKLLQELGSPVVKFHRARPYEGNGWTSLLARLRSFWPEKANDLDLQDLKFWSPNFGHLLLALLLGKENCVEGLVRAGMAPHSARELDALGALLHELKALPAELASKLTNTAKPQFALAESWLSRQRAQYGEVQDLLDQQDLSAPAVENLRRKVAALVPLDYWPLAKATELGDARLLQSMFAAGADPNSLYKTGVPVLARIGGEKLSPALLQVWLDAGANPAFGAHAELPYGDGSKPSILYQFVWEGRLDLARQATDKAVAPVALTYQREGKKYAPLLALALSRGHEDIVEWLMREKGCTLQHLDDVSGRACGKFGDDALRAKAKAFQASATR